MSWESTQKVDVGVGMAVDGAHEAILMLVPWSTMCLWPSEPPMPMPMPVLDTVRLCAMLVIETEAAVRFTARWVPEY